MKNKTDVLVLSCDSYSDTWKIFYDLKSKYWKDCPYDTYLVTETKDCDYFKTIKTTGAWTKRVREALIKLDSDFILVMLDDFFIRDYVDQERIDNLINYFDNDIAEFNVDLTVPTLSRHGDQ